MTFPSDQSGLNEAATLAPARPLRKRLALLGLAATAMGMGVFSYAASAEGDKEPVETEAGIPVTDKLVIAKCGTCHTADAKGNLSRISWNRTTPEGWAQVIHRMVKLNGLSITADEAKIGRAHV